MNLQENIDSTMVVDEVDPQGWIVGGRAEFGSSSKTENKLCEREEELPNILSTNKKGFTTAKGSWKKVKQVLR